MDVSMIRDRYDVVIAGARCAGASTAMLLARAGLSVLVVDPARPGSDTLSTHALMRGAVLQLHRWGLLDEVRAAGTPEIRTTTFYYGDEAIEVDIRPKDGVDGLFAPRRTVLDPVLVWGARAAGAEVAYGMAIAGVTRDASGRVRGAVVATPDGATRSVAADVVIGADGVRSRVARLVGAGVDYAARHATSSIYGHWPELGIEGYHWYYELGAGIGAIPTNDGLTCVFASIAPDRFRAERALTLETVYRRTIREVSPELADRMARIPAVKLRAFAGVPGFLRRSAGAGWALVGDAGYFKDPLTAHGITDALRDAELLANAVVRGGDEALLDYQAARDRTVRGLLDVTDRVASLDWDLEQLKELHLELSREMNAEVEVVRAFDAARTAA